MISQKLDGKMDHEAFPALQGLPQLKIASNAEAMRDLFGRHLRPGAGGAYHIEDCILTRIRRYRQEARCVLQYNLRLVNSETGDERTEWLKGVIYSDDGAEPLGPQFKAFVPSQDVPEASPLFAPVSFIPELRMVVQVFPHDQQLPALPLLTGRPPAEVESLLLGEFGPGKWRTESWNIEPKGYRAGVAAVLRYRVRARDASSGRRKEKHFYLKLYCDQKGEQIYELARVLWDKGNIGGDHFTVGRPIAYLSDLRVLVQEEAPGISFQRVFLDGQGREVDSAARRVARALAALHLDQIHTGQRRLLQDRVANLKKVARLLQWACPDLKEDVASIVRTAASRSEEIPLGPTHLDLKTDHILLDNERISLLDLDSFALADQVFDVAYILAQMFGKRSLFLGPHDGLQSAARAFAEEYFNHVPGAWRSRLAHNYASAALKVALGFFRRQEPQWSEKAATLVAEAKDSLAGKSWCKDFLP